MCGSEVDVVICDRVAKRRRRNGRADEMNMLKFVYRICRGRHLPSLASWPYPLRTPRIRFITKKAPSITIETKYIHCQLLPMESWIEYITSVQPSRVIHWNTVNMDSPKLSKFVMPLFGPSQSRLQIMSSISGISLHWNPSSPHGFGSGIISNVPFLKHVLWSFPENSSSPMMA